MSAVPHAPGTFCWAELMTSNADEAKAFYAKLFGWDHHDDQIPGGGVYTMLQLADENVGGLYELSEEMKSKGVPPNWLSYITVEDARAAAAKAKELGGIVQQDAFDVMEIGSMAVLQDPSGAVFAVWQPKLHTGSGYADGRPSTFCWNELITHDVDAAGKFYTDMFDWEADAHQMEPMQYTIFKAGEKQCGGMMPVQKEWGDVPSHWMIYFAVDDADATATRIEELGGKLLSPLNDIPEVGRFAVAQDPQGAVFSFIKLAPAPA